MIYATSKPINAPRKYNTIKTDAPDYLLAVLSHYSSKSDGSCLMCLPCPYSSSACAAAAEFLDPPSRISAGRRLLTNEDRAAELARRWGATPEAAPGSPSLYLVRGLFRRRLPVGKDLPWIRFCRQEPAHRVCDLVTKPCSPEPQPEIELARVPSMAAGLLDVSSQKLIPSSHPWRSGPVAVVNNPAWSSQDRHFPARSSPESSSFLSHTLRWNPLWILSIRKLEFFFFYLFVETTV